MRRLLALTLSACLTTGVMALTAGTADARSIIVPDPSGDVMSSVLELVLEDCDLEVDEECDLGDGELEAPDVVRDETPVGDVVATTFGHHRRSITITTQYMDLRRPRADEQLSWMAFTRGANGQQRIVLLEASRRRPGGVVRVERMSNERTVCRGNVTRRVDYAANTISVRLPRWCAGSPRRVKLSGATFRMLSRETKDTVRIEQYYDNPFVDGGPLDDLPDLGWTPWLRRG